MDNKNNALSPIQRKIRKLRNKPMLFVADSKVVKHTNTTLYYTWAKLGSFALVLAATLLICIYYLFIASDSYVSEAKLVVKQASSTEITSPGLPLLTGMGSGAQDALLIKSYIGSLDLMRQLQADLDVRAHYSSDKADFISALGREVSAEDFLAYMQEHIKVSYDEISNEITVSVQAFEAEYAQQVLQKVVDASELFINNMGQQMAKEQMQYAQREVERAHKVMQDAQHALIEFQEKYSVLSPEQQGSAVIAALSGIETQIISGEAELKALQSYMRNDAPEVQARRYKLDALKNQLASERKKLSKNDEQTYNKLNASFQEYKLNVQLGADLYTSALAGLETARGEAYHKLKHLIRVTTPNLPEKALYPRRIYNIVTWFVVLLMIFAIYQLVVATIREHQE